MGRRFLYIFIDESGNPASGSYYTLAGSWCVSTETNAGHVLSATKNKCLACLQSGIPELKGSKLAPETLDLLHSSLSNFAHEDQSIESQGPRWTARQPIRHTLYNVTPAVAHEVAYDLANIEHGRTELLKTMALIGVLDPIFYGSRVGDFSEIRVVLDSNTWQNAAGRLDSALDGVEDLVPSKIEFSTRDSKSTPGIQISDMTAYSWARNRRHGDCGTSVECINDRLFRDL